MDSAILRIWAKTSTNIQGAWHPLVLHMLDVAASADAILMREPESTRNRMAAILGMRWEDARPWLLLIIACHDLGKACPGFQCKWRDMTGLKLPRVPDTRINHAFVSQIELSRFFQHLGWSVDLADLVADAVGCHHGERASEKARVKAELEICVGRGQSYEQVRNEWNHARSELLEALMAVFNPSKIPDKETLSGPDFMLLSGLTSFADWIGSNDEWFPFGTPEDCEDLPGWFAKRRACAERALNAIGWEQRAPLVSEPKTFDEVFPFKPRPLQKAVQDALKQLDRPAILLVEAPMGEGKTEAAFFAHLEMQRRNGHRGLYMALPTKATGNAMFKRTLKLIRAQGKDRKLDMQLVHGATQLNDSFQNLRLTGIHDPEAGGEVRAGEWFTNKKRALLSEYGVGTVDQAIVPILPVRHNFVRLWGLANRVVVFDEVHAYDSYTGTLLIHLIHWLLELGSSVVLLSATLPPRFRRELAKVVKAELPVREPAYPRLSVFLPGSVRQSHFAADPSRRLELKLKGIPPDLQNIKSALEDHLKNGGMGLALVNTVQRAQDLYNQFSNGEPLKLKEQFVGKRLDDGTEVYLFHARFPAERRQVREDQVLALFGEGGDRNGRKILVATQVVEQSLDLDFDLIVTDLAPIDLILQRAGRLWRHKQDYRALSEPTLIVAGLAGGEPPPFGKPLWWGEVYREDMLLSTWILLRNEGRQTITLPDEIDILVEAVYEERVIVPDSLKGRMDQALIAGEGKTIPLRGQANQAIIGLPDDASWNDPGRFVLYDEDEPGVHRTLMAQTRQGNDSVIAIPIFLDDNFTCEAIPDFATAKQWFLRSVSLSRKGVVGKLRGIGVPEGWKKSSLLRNCFPLVLDENFCWAENMWVRLDDELGLVYEPKENE